MKYEVKVKRGQWLGRRAEVTDSRLLKVDMLLINSLRYSIVRVIVRVPKNLKKNRNAQKAKYQET